MLQDGSIVTVKKADNDVEMQVEQFVNEVFILTQIDHGHIVKLLGCCLETEVPLLVYERISNGTLSHHLHEKVHGKPPSTLSWENRLGIANEIAHALDYCIHMALHLSFTGISSLTTYSWMKTSGL